MHEGVLADDPDLPTGERRQGYPDHAGEVALDDHDDTVEGCGRMGRVRDALTPSVSPVVSGPSRGPQRGQTLPLHERNALEATGQGQDTHGTVGLIVRSPSIGEHRHARFTGFDPYPLLME
jgi:hypothetical protein